MTLLPPHAMRHSRSIPTLCMPADINTQRDRETPLENIANKVAAAANTDPSGNKRRIKLVSIKSALRPTTTPGNSPIGPFNVPKGPITFPQLAFGSPSDSAMKGKKPEAGCTDISKRDRKEEAYPTKANPLPTDKKNDVDSDPGVRLTLMQISKLLSQESIYEFVKALDLCKMPHKNISDRDKEQFLKHQKLIFEKLQRFKQMK